MSEYLVDISGDSVNHALYVMVQCPICGEQIIDDVEESKHNHDDPVADHIASHDPEDLGLSEYEFRPMADILVELHGLGRETEEAV